MNLFLILIPQSLPCSICFCIYLTGPKFAIPQFGSNSYYNENRVQKTDPVFRSNNEI